MKMGKSIVQFAHEIGVARSTVYKWSEEISDFSDALQRGQDASETFWETHIQNGATGEIPTINVAATALILKCRFGWRDKDPAIFDKDKGDGRPDEVEKLRLATMRKDK